MSGASEGGIVTTLLIERHPALFSGGMAACGPIGSFPKQIDYWGDDRVPFNYFFPGVIPIDASDPISMPQSVIDNWDSVYQPAVTNAITSNPNLAQQLIETSKALVGPLTAATTALSTTLDVMWYNVFATDDGIQELHGNPYDNIHRWYTGSSNDLRLNLDVERFSADPSASAQMNNYQTSGNLTLPLVTLHTTGDDIIPFWHELLYKAKAHPTGAGRLTQIPISAYGHCNFTTGQILGAFALLVLQVSGHAPAGIPAADLSAIRQDLGTVNHLTTQLHR
jgi:pimeloyl-ACP methyl ester carboxylesterase